MSLNTLTFRYSEGDDTVTFTLSTGDADIAEAVVDDIQTICGSSLERDEDFVYFMVDGDQVEDAVRELRETDPGVDAAAYDAEEGA